MAAGAEKLQVEVERLSKELEEAKEVRVTAVLTGRHIYVSSECYVACDEWVWHPAFSQRARELAGCVALDPNGAFCPPAPTASGCQV